jgi:hypothetical protein
MLWIAVLLTIVWIIFAGLTNFNSELAFDFPPNAFVLDQNFFLGLGSALLIAVYDYWGYYNVNFFAGEVKDPEKTIPRSIMLSIGLIAVIYIVMNISILGVIPWREFMETANSDARRYVISVFMERLYGSTAGIIATFLIMLTAFASVFSLLLGYSRVPFAASLDGNYFRFFRYVHPEHRFPYVSLLIMGGIAGPFLFFPPCRCRGRAGRDQDNHPVPGSDRRAVDPAGYATRVPTSLQNVAVSAAGAHRVARFRLRPLYAARLSEGDQICRRACHGRVDHISDTLVSKKGVPVR